MSGTGESFARWAWHGAGTGPALTRAALLPFAALFRLGVLARNAAYDAGALAARALPLPSIGVGNLAVGGAGKTPLVGFIARGLARRGVRPAILLRGYGGDETALHVADARVMVVPGADRHAAAREAAGRGAEVLVLDDCLQRRDVIVDEMLAVVAAETWDGVRWPLPAGPWREGVEALWRADAVVVTRKSAPVALAARLAEELAPRTGGRAVMADLAIVALRPLGGGPIARPETLAGADVLAVSGIGEPDAFAAQLAALGARVQPLAFGDHHPYTAADTARIAGAAAGRTVVTTAKDAVKLHALWPASGPRCVIAELEVRPAQGGDVLDEVLDRVAEAARHTSSPQAAGPLAHS